MRTVVALGGNALSRANEKGTAAEQRANLRRTVPALALLLGDELVVTHGNGPQVGNELLRQERAADVAPPLPLWLAVAQTQAEIGALIEGELAPAARREVACLLTHVVVARDDPAFGEPTKPIGPFYGREQAEALRRERDWNVAEDAGRGWRRVVPSPAPLEVVELGAIQRLLDGGSVVVACGGGGIPVVRRDGGFDGIDAVIDKDRASAVLAEALGAERLIILTGVDAVERGFGTPEAEQLRELGPDEAEALLPELPAGSMRPKVEAAARFARAGGEALITSAGALAGAMAGRAGTHVRA